MASLCQPSATGTVFNGLPFRRNDSRCPAEPFMRTTMVAAPTSPSQGKRKLLVVVPSTRPARSCSLVTPRHGLVYSCVYFLKPSLATGITKPR